MSHGDASDGSRADDGVETGSRHELGGSSGGALSTLRNAVGKRLRSGTLAGVGGGVAVVSGLRAFRRGKRVSGALRMAVGGALLALTARQRQSDAHRSGGVDQTDVVDTAPDVGDVSEGTGGPTRHAGGDEAAAVAESSADIEDVSEGARGEAGPEATGDEAADVAGSSVDVGDAAGESSGEAADESADAATSEGAASVDRLGEAALDGESREVPAPQRAFDREFLALDAEAVWGIREEDDAVVVSQLYDPIADGDEFRYVASSQVDEERYLIVPDEILDHWDEMAGGGTAVEGGDDVVFATTDDLTADSQLLVVPAAWADEQLGDGES